MTTLILGFIFMGLIVLAMSVGVLFGRKPIKGSCGGLSALGLKESCDICGGQEDLCKKEQLKRSQAQSNEGDNSLAYDASKSQR